MPKRDCIGVPGVGKEWRFLMVYFMSNAWPMVALGDLLTKSDEWITLLPDETYREVTAKLWGKGSYFVAKRRARK